MKKNEMVRLRIEKLRFPCKGEGEADGERVIVPFTLPGQEWLVRVQKKRHGQVLARAQELLMPSPLEGPSGCPAFGVCGGCVYQTISDGEELRLKERMVLDLLAEAGIKGFVYDGAENAPDTREYRNKCEFSFGDTEKDGPLALGMRQRQSYYQVADLSGCNLVNGDYRALAAATKAYFRETKTPFYHTRRHEGVLRHLVIRRGTYTGEVLVNLVTTSAAPPLSGWVEVLRGLPLSGTLVGILHTVHDGVADVALGQETRILYGRDYLTERLFGLEFQVTATSFFQTNTRGAERLYARVREYAGNVKDQAVYDLYCGTGTIAQILARDCRKVYGVELWEAAVADARKAAAHNKIENVEFLAGDVLALLDELPEEPGLVVLDPPREGVNPKAIKKLVERGVPRMVYVSCKPTSLARDLAAFQAGGYRVERLAVVNQFPRTAHVECCALLCHE